MKGTYALLIKLPQNTQIRIGKLGEIEFKEKDYAYIGSALKNLEKRIERHLQEEKNLYWHIDYLLTEAYIQKVLYGESEEKKECIIAENLAEKFNSIKDFGSSDCQCRSHLLYSQNTQELEDDIISSFKETGLEPKKW